MGKPKRAKEPVKRKEKVPDKDKPSHNKDSSVFRSTVALFLISLSIGVISYVWLAARDVALSRPDLPNFNITASVPVKVLSSPSTKFSQSCADAGTPVILKNSVATRWKAREWTPSYLEKKLSKISGVYENTNRWFGPYFDKQKPLLSFAQRVNNYKTNLKLASQEFFRRIQSTDSDSSSFLYFTGDIDQLGEWAIKEIEPFEELLSLNPRHSSINAWIGQPHVIAHCHYDGYHNFYAQLYGKKRFLLLRPTNWPGLYPYPFLHPSHAQAQVNVSSLEEQSKFPLVQKVETFEAVLEPGDLLYIPPLWFHEVESLDVSISVNVWTDSAQTKVAEKLYQLSLPINAYHWSSGRPKWIATSLLLFQAMQHVCTHQRCERSVTDKFRDGYQGDDSALSDTGAIYFMHRLWSTRYRTLMADGKLPNSLPDSDILCEREWNREEIGEAKTAAHTAMFGEYAQSVGALVEELPGDTWELWVGNYVEFVVANAVPSVEYVGVFLKHFSSCLLAKN